MGVGGDEAEGGGGAELEALMRTEFMYFCIKSSIGTQGKVG